MHRYTAQFERGQLDDFYTFGTNGTVVFEPRFTFHVFRMSK